MKKNAPAKTGKTSKTATVSAEQPTTTIVASAVTRGRGKGGRFTKKDETPAEQPASEAKEAVQPKKRGRKPSIAKATEQAGAKVQGKKRGRKPASIQDRMNAIQPPADAKVEAPKSTTPARTRGRRANAEIAGRSQVIKRGGRNLINPTDIVIDWDNKHLGANPRIQFGKNKKDWELFKENIKDKGVQQSVKLYLGADDKWHLRHGYRRMKAVQELLAEGHLIEFVPFDEVPDNEEEALVDHFDLNNGKPLTDIEAAEGLRRLRQLTGQTNVAELARRVHIPYIKAVNLLNFADQAATQVKKAVIDGKLSFSVAKNIVNVAKNVTEQVKLLKEGESHAKTIGKDKIRIHSISKVKEAKLPVDKKIIEILEEAVHIEGVDVDFINKVSNFVEAVREGKSAKQIFSLLTEAHA